MTIWFLVCYAVVSTFTKYLRMTREEFPEKNQGTIPLFVVVVVFNLSQVFFLPLFFSPIILFPLFLLL